MVLPLFPYYVRVNFDLIFRIILLLAASIPMVAGTAHDLETANRLLETGKYCEALKIYRANLAANPNSEDLLYNGGLAALQCGDFAAALEFLRPLEALAPDDWQVRAKLVQTYQGLGKLPERDKERAELLALRKRGDNQSLMKQAQYCRERFESGGEHVMAFELFEFTGERAVRYVFQVLNDAGDQAKYRISLGSYEVTNRVWHNRTTPAPPAEARLFHLDGYWENSHATYAMFPGEPSYDDVRALVVKILNKELKPVSGTMISPRPAK